MGAGGGGGVAGLPRHICHPFYHKQMKLFGTGLLILVALVLNLDLDVYELMLMYIYILNIRCTFSSFINDVLGYLLYNIILSYLVSKGRY